jgi:hypothetical protein
MDRDREYIVLQYGNSYSLRHVGTWKIVFHQLTFDQLMTRMDELEAAAGDQPIKFTHEGELIAASFMDRRAEKKNSHATSSTSAPADSASEDPAATPIEATPENESEATPGQQGRSS